MRYYQPTRWFRFLSAFAMLACWQTLAIANPDAEKPPNILLIVSDDQGYNDLGCFGSEEIITPNLDRLAQEGVKLTNFYVAWPACTPSRAGFLTGRFPQRNGIYDMIRNEAPDYGKKYTPAEYEVSFERIGGMDTREIILPAMLAARGYRSGIFGKWDLGTLHRFLPLQKGFDRFYGFVNTGIDYFTHERYGVPSMYRDNSPTEADKGTYCTDLFRREAEAFLADVHDQPFFLYLPFNAPHGASNLDSIIRSAAQGTEEYKKLYPELASKAGKQQGQRYGKPATVLNKASRRLEFAASVTQMDAAIGGILKKLEDYGVADNTIVIFFSDNGGGGAANNSPLRGKKGQMFEGGIRVPAIIKYPNVLPAGETRQQFCTALDILPSLLTWTGVEKPKEVHLDGFDLSPMLQENIASPRKSMFWQRKDMLAARIHNWKCIQTPGHTGLYDLSNDIGESKDLSDSRPEKLLELKTAFQRWRREMDECEPRRPFRNF